MNEREKEAAEFTRQHGHSPQWRARFEARVEYARGIYSIYGASPFDWWCTAVCFLRELTRADR